MAKQKVLGPNISAHALDFLGETLKLHHRGDGCKARIVHTIKNRQLSETVGRPYCQKCKRLVGKKAWRKLISGKLFPGDQIDWISSRHPDTNENYRTYFRAKGLKPVKLTGVEIRELRDIVARLPQKQLRQLVAQQAPELLGFLNDLPSYAEGQQSGPLAYLEDSIQPPVPGPQPRTRPIVTVIAIMNNWVLNYRNMRLEFSRDLFSMDDAERLAEGVRDLPEDVSVRDFERFVGSIMKAIHDGGGPYYCVEELVPTLEHAHRYAIVPFLERGDNDF